MSETAEKLQALIGRLEDGQAFLFTGSPDGYTIHDVGYGDRALPTSNEVRHVGFGLFMAHVPGGHDAKSEISFDAGGALAEIADGENYRLAYTPLRATADQLENMGYDFSVPLAYLRGELAKFTN
jgi:hypothetical protein